MKYWLLTSEYPPFFGGGISTYCLHTATMLTEKGYDVSVFVNDPSVKEIAISEKDSIRIIRFSPSSTKESLYLGHVTSISYEFAQIVKLFIEKEGKPDIIESQEYLGIAYYLLQFKKLCYSWCENVPVIITMHSPSFLYMEYNHISEYRYPNYWICEMERFCLQAADYIISPSNYMVTELNKRFKLGHHNISVIPNPFRFVKSQSAVVPQKGGEIIFLGKLTAQKGAFQLLNYFKQLWDTGFNRSLSLIGEQDIVYHPEGKMMGDIIRRDYRKFIDTGLLKLENKITPSQISNRLKAAEVVILPSNNDNLPYVVAEMMSLGKIVLASKQGGHSEVINESVNGFIFDHSIPDTFSQQLNKVLKLEENVITEISKNAIVKIENYFNYSCVFEKKEAVIKKLIENKSDKITEFPYINKPLQKLAYSPESKNSKLSIVIPYYNLGLYLEDTIQSIRNSTYTDKEIIIVNDGSTDGHSLNVLNKFRDQAGIKVIDTINNGIAQARNIGIENATGNYIAFLDADDLVRQEYYSKGISVLEKYKNVHFVGSWIQYFGDSNHIWPAFNPEPPIILYHNLVNSSSLIYKKESLLLHGLNDDNMLFQGWEDYESVVSMIANDLYGVVLPETLFLYRIRKDSMIRHLSKAKKILLHQYISQKHWAVYKKFSVKVFNLQNANGPSIETDNPSLDYHLSDRIPWKGRSSQRIIKLIKKNKQIRNAAYQVYRLIKK